MPSKNIVKPYVEGGVYHLYNRGVEKRLIFLDDRDYRVFLSYLKLYLSPPTPEVMNRRHPHKDLSGEIELIAYCLMPNHFHLMVRQISERGITSLMRCVLTNYVAYFNRRYQRVGGLFQDTYKGALADTDEYLMHLSRYIHLNPLKLATSPIQYPYSSYEAYIGSNDVPQWLKPSCVKQLFTDDQAYLQFTNSQVDSAAILAHIAID